MKRTLNAHILKDLESKIVLLSGARQTGKTTLSKQLSEHRAYFNYDSSEDRILLLKKRWDRSCDLLIFDELHKMRHWKRWLKGIYDTEGLQPKILVTGSAKLDVHRRVGDSLAGRYFQYRLHPIDIKEAHKNLLAPPEELFETLWHCSGFPEPFLKASALHYKRWRKSHIDIILRQDLIDISSVRDIDAIQTLIYLLAQRCGSTVSYANISRDLDRDPNTIKRWLFLLENLYIIHRVTPYSHKIARSLKKEPKFYFYDHCLVEDPGARLENLVANALRKELDFLEDSEGIKGSLHFLRTKDGVELDFLCCIDHKPSMMIEVKMSDTEPSRAFGHYAKQFTSISQVQLVKNLTRSTSLPSGLFVKPLIPWLTTCELRNP